MFKRTKKKLKINHVNTHNQIKKLIVVRMDDSGKEINNTHTFGRARMDNLAKYIKVGDTIYDATEIQSIRCSDLSCEISLKSRKSVDYYSKFADKDAYIDAKKIHDKLS